MMLENIRKKCYVNLHTVSHDFPKISVDPQKTAVYSRLLKLWLPGPSTTLQGDKHTEVRKSRAIAQWSLIVRDISALCDITKGTLFVSYRRPSEKRSQELKFGIPFIHTRN